ncbi:hypothetical protein AAFF_G00434560 [Aldrovandia affinis]|uniref:Uncharacterized protein n=1 Tax=Aldrovandia affinis TaxID=143900 RepID=A0AAD7WI35_9TELE|nr:hypothetical protein AAFF_G00434560 [Aldrovandia affinis]
MCGAFGTPPSALGLCIPGGHAGDIFLLQEVHLRDVEDAAALSRCRTRPMLASRGVIPGAASRLDYIFVGGGKVA